VRVGGAGVTSTIAEIMLVCDLPIEGVALKQIITDEAGLSIACEPATAEEALQFARTSHVDLAIVDLSRTGVHGLNLIRELRHIAPGLLVLALSDHDDTVFAALALRAGARGFISEPDAANNLIVAIRQVLSGQIYLSDPAAQVLLNTLGRPDTMLRWDRLGSLTDRELEVFELIGRGLSTADIAIRLRVSVKTIETYRANIKAKLNLKDANDLLRHALLWVEQL
jgi:DNA-binding NarL/FixJ family response regulator